MNLIIEEINRSKRVIQRHRFKDASRIRIGRALDNDIILSEPHVSPYHMELQLTAEGHWIVRDLDSCNGVRSNRRKILATGTEVESGDTLLLGRSYIRIWDEQHPVEDAWPLHSVEDFFHAISSIWFVMLLLGTFLVGEWQLANLQNYQDVSPSRLINELIYELLFIFGWASLWSLSGRITRHESRFMSHLAVSLIAAMAFQWAPLILRIFAFNGQYGLWLTEIRYFINGAIFSMLLWCNFYLTLPQKSSVRIIWSNLIAWGMVLVFLLPPLFESNQYKGYPDYDRLMMHPDVFWADAVSTDDFVKATDSLYSEFSDEVKTKPASIDNATELNEETL